jgi:hypothetical protein
VSQYVGLREAAINRGFRNRALKNTGANSDGEMMLLRNRESVKWIFEDGAESGVPGIGQECGAVVARSAKVR